MEDFLALTYFQNTVYDYLIAFGAILIGLVLVQAFRAIILKRLRKWSASTNTNVDDFIVDSIDRFGVPALYFAVIYMGLSYLILSERGQNIVQIATTIAITILAIRFISTVLLLLLRSYVRKQENGDEKVRQLGGLMIIINMIIWMVGLVFIFDNMGYDVTAIVAGLGIGGIAIALAAQNILGDLFNYFVIFFDRPFEIGDFIIIDTKSGVVEYIGIKTTRVKSLSGEQLVFSNSDLTGSRIHNYKRMQRRRAVFKIGVTYQTTFEQLKAIPELLKSIVKEEELAEIDRAHFMSYGESSLDFEVVYFVLNPDYGTYADVQQKINLRIFEEFEKMGVEFAYPTRTLFIAKEEKEAEEKV